MDDDEDIDEDDEDLNDAMAIKIQMMTNKNFADVEKLDSVEGSPPILPTPFSTAMAVKANNLIDDAPAHSAADAALKNSMYSHIDKVIFLHIKTTSNVYELELYLYVHMHHFQFQRM